MSSSPFACFLQQFEDDMQESIFDGIAFFAQAMIGGDCGADREVNRAI